MKKILDQIELFLICVTAFMIPIHIKLTSMTIFGLIVIALLKPINYNGFKGLLKNYRFYVFISPLIIAITGLIYTQFFLEAQTQIEIVVSLLLFPFIFVSFSNNSIKIKTELFLSFFVISALFAYFVCMSVAVPSAIRAGNVNYLFYSKLSSIIKGPHHLSYSVLFAIVLLAFSVIGQLNLFIQKSAKLTVFKLLSLIFLVVFLLQLSSKVTILFLFLFSIAFFVYLVRKKIISFKYGILVIVLFLSVSAFVLSLPTPRARFAGMFNAIINKADTDHQSHESTRLRLAAINASYNIAKENFWFGVGTGDVSNEMNSYYKENNVQGAYILNISPHNQFLRTFVMYGFVGLLLLISIFGIMILDAVKNKNRLYLTWTLFMIALFAVEDMFLIQDGVIFFAFFSAFFLFEKSAQKLTQLKYKMDE